MIAFYSGTWDAAHISFIQDANQWFPQAGAQYGFSYTATNDWNQLNAANLASYQVDNLNHPATAGLPATITSAVSEWHSWQYNVRQNPAIDILASMAPSTFPIGTDPNQIWYSGGYPIVWSSRNYKMVYNNFGHNAMNYSTNTALSSTFASAQQNQLLIQELWHVTGKSGPVIPPPGSAELDGR